ncbi:MAG TPA: DUF1292 domain-containing protein [bacterium]|jgi:hypothetical protein|nr:DUF1292 domain-containing protein [Dictyoglomota bacterium]HHV80193.1 DUF1292 domain-containing protein [bacterium]HOK29725.1 DUF1292 domain-containing protein [bacterium]HON72164.1 DUF1292 domain-containing protein [bacterium]HPC77632.1 DUF1292 domain-containing protein [bacterium]
MEDSVKIIDEFGNYSDFQVIDLFNIKDKDYIVLAPQGEIASAFIMRIDGGMLRELTDEEFMEVELYLTSELEDREVN